MSTNEIISKMKALREWESLYRQCAGRGRSSPVTASKPKWKSGIWKSLKQERISSAGLLCSVNRFDSSAFKKSYADPYKTFTKQVLVTSLQHQRVREGLKMKQLTSYNRVAGISTSF